MQSLKEEVYDIFLGACVNMLTNYNQYTRNVKITFTDNTKNETSTNSMYVSDDGYFVYINEINGISMVNISKLANDNTLLYSIVGDQVSEIDVKMNPYVYMMLSLTTGTAGAYYDCGYSLNHVTSVRVLPNGNYEISFCHLNDEDYNPKLISRLTVEFDAEKFVKLNDYEFVTTDMETFNVSDITNSYEYGSMSADDMNSIIEDAIEKIKAEGYDF